MAKTGKYIDAGVYCNITYIRKGERRIEGDRRHLMKIIMDCAKTEVTDNKCKRCINKYRIHSVDGLIHCKNNRTGRRED